LAGTPREALPSEELTICLKEKITGAAHQATGHSGAEGKTPGINQTPRSPRCVRWTTADYVARRDWRESSNEKLQVLNTGHTFCCSVWSDERGNGRFGSACRRALCRRGQGDVEAMADGSRRWRLQDRSRVVLMAKQGATVTAAVLSGDKAIEQCSDDGNLPIA